MQILQWLFKADQEKNAPVSSIANGKEFAHHARDKKKDIVACSNRKGSSRSRKREKVNLDCKDLNKYLASLLRRGNLQTVFHSSLYIYRLKIKREATGSGRNKLGSTDETATHHVGNKVLPVSDSDSSSTRSTRRKKQNERRDNNVYSCDQRNGDGRSKGVSRMKELLRWSEAAKSQKGRKRNRRKVMHSTRQVESGECVRECLETSFRCDGVEICPTVSEECRKGNWITTDDEFVVLEL